MFVYPHILIFSLISVYDNVLIFLSSFKIEYQVIKMLNFSIPSVKYIFLLIIYSILINPVLHSGCAVNPATQRTELMLVSEEKEFQIGQQVDKQVREEMGIYLELPGLRDKVKEVVENIGKQSHRPDLIYRAEIIDTPDFNAFAVPGGFVYVHRGLLERINSMDELASVISHEIAHVAARHSASQMTKMQLLNIGLLGAVIASKGAIQDYGSLVDIGSILAFSKFSRDDEREADYFGIRYMTGAGYNPKASISVMKEIQGLQDREPDAMEVWFMTHPPTSERLVILNNELAALSSQDPDIVKKDIRRNEFIKLLEGMVTGEWNGKELVKGERYYNKEFLLSIPLPEKWQAQINTKDYTAVFFDTKKEMFAYFDIQALRKIKPTGEYYNELAELLEKKGLKKVPGSFNPGKLSHGAISGMFYGSSSSSGPVAAQLTAFTKEDKGYYILGLGKKELIEKNLTLFQSMINGMEFISQTEASKIDPPRMRIYKVSKGDTWEKITRNFYNSARDKGKLAGYNGLDDQTQPEPGILLKIPPTLLFN